MSMDAAPAPDLAAVLPTADLIHGREAIEAAISQVVVQGNSFYTVIMRDVTERNRIMQALDESERVHRTLLSNLSGMAYRRRNAAAGFHRGDLVRA